MFNKIYKYFTNVTFPGNNITPTDLFNQCLSQNILIGVLGGSTRIISHSTKVSK